MKLIRHLLIVLLVLLTVGCASNINLRNANQHANAANAAAQAGDWTTARKQWAKALVNAELAKMPARQLAIVNYEYGRALGVQCFWQESEDNLLKAFELDHQTGGPEFMALLELSRLQYDQQNYAKSLPYYRRAIASMEVFDAPGKAPAEFSVVLDEYAKALRSAGKEQEADSALNRATEKRLKHPGKQSITDRTPYGTQCPGNQ